MIRVRPGEILREELDARDLEVREFSRSMGIPPHVMYGIVLGTEDISAFLAGKIGAALGTGPDLWLKLQKAYNEGGRRA